MLGRQGQEGQDWKTGRFVRELGKIPGQDSPAWAYPGLEYDVLFVMITVTSLVESRRISSNAIPAFPWLALSGFTSQEFRKWQI